MKYAISHFDSCNNNIAYMYTHLHSHSKIFAKLLKIAKAEI